MVALAIDLCVNPRTLSSGLIHCNKSASEAMASLLAAYMGTAESLECYQQ